ncbi:hypothetical protein A0J48_001380 [Sphaerospermopsis aphanizomenoides BCCUSP55]|uniref:hypothetical protein n=1 Tax=Sphaerospermopsis aphanizomenoides TaxID=459663 RepID=UPI001907F2F0|nr:hypothetical protein [Sphaerospermopsis aphanizomenoides]MBK1986214.1 hypothetical protein [Sphaerospermopsis aphanizomenoides BCCUSP55]
MSNGIKLYSALERIDNFTSRIYVIYLDVRSSGVPGVPGVQEFRSSGVQELQKFRSSRSSRSMAYTTLRTSGVRKKKKSGIEKPVFSCIAGDIAIPIPVRYKQ